MVSIYNRPIHRHKAAILGLLQELVTGPAQYIWEREGFGVHVAFDVFSTVRTKPTS